MFWLEKKGVGGGFTTIVEEIKGMLRSFFVWVLLSLPSMSCTLWKVFVHNTGSP